MIDTRTVQVDTEVRLEVATSGDDQDPTVLLVHGNGPNWRQFTPQLSRRPTTGTSRRHHVATGTRRCRQPRAVGI